MNDAAATKSDAPNHPMLPCTGEAHSNPHIDNCTLCAPRWGKVPAFKGCSREARFLLNTLSDSKRGYIEAPGLPRALTDAAFELEGFGYVKPEIVQQKNVSFIGWRLTPLGHDAIRQLMRKGGR